MYTCSKQPIRGGRVPQGSVPVKIDIRKIWVGRVFRYSNHCSIRLVTKQQKVTTYGIVNKWCTNFLCPLFRTSSTQQLYRQMNDVRDSYRVGTSSGKIITLEHRQTCIQSTSNEKKMFYIWETRKPDENRIALYTHTLCAVTSSLPRR